MKSGAYFPSRLARRLTGLVCAGAFLTAAGASEALATPIGVNLIVNPGAEGSAGAADYSTTLAPVGWVTTSNFSVVQYAAGGPADLNTAASSAIGGGNNYFAGGPDNGQSTASQSILFPDLASSIDSGMLGFVLSGYLGGWASQADTIQVTANFLSGANTVLLSSTIGPVSSADRGGNSELLFRTTDITAVPIGARSLNILLTSTRLDGAYNDGYADNLSFQFRDVAAPTAVPEPASLTLLSLGLAGVIRQHFKRRQ